MQASGSHDVARADDETNHANRTHDAGGLGDGDGTDGTIAHEFDAMTRSIFARDGNPNEYLPGGFLGMARC